MKDKKILVTSALPYANGPIHIGHLIEYIQTDIYVRMLRLSGNDAIYVCADDTHGTPIEINAQKQGKTPEDFIAHWYKEHTRDFASFGIRFDSYYTTHSEESRRYTEQIFLKLKEKGLIYTKDIELTYCENDKRFLPDRFVKGKCPKCGAPDQYGDICEKCNSAYKPTELIDPYCSVCGTKPTTKMSTHYFFRLSEFSDRLHDYISGNPRLQPEIKNQILNWIKSGLEDWNISRDAPYFGFRIPGEEAKYFYVWLDAPIGYIASTANFCKGKGCSADDYWKEDGRFDSDITHFIGKDIIYFHLLFWPAVLMGAGFHPPDNVVVHGFLTVNGEKMSKSRGTFLMARDLVGKIDPEFIRYYYASNLTHSMTDIDLDFGKITEKVNNELVANIANFVYRVISFANSNFDSQITSVENVRLVEEVQAKAEEARIFMEKLEFKDAVRVILEMGSLGNRYFQERQPWFLIKTNRDETQKVITDCVNMIKSIIICLKPIMPEYAAKVESQLGMSDLTFDDVKSLEQHRKLGKGEIILKKIEKIQVGAPEEKKAEDPFSKVHIKVGRIDEISGHYSADKLYVINVDMGGYRKQIVSGLVPYYPDKMQLLGKKVLILDNLEHADLRGERSEGMLLVSESKDGHQVEVLEAPHSKEGESVFVEGIAPSGTILTFKEFQKVKIVSHNGDIIYNGKNLQTKTEKIKANTVKNGIVR